MTAVYIITAEAIQACKIGVAANPESRLPELQTGNPVPLKLFWVAECEHPYLVERAAHKALEAHRLHGEWFGVPPDMAAQAISDVMHCVSPIVGMDKLRSYLNAMPSADREAFARRCGTSFGYLRKAASVKARMDVSLCIAIERESSGAVRCEDLRPDVDWSFFTDRGAA